MIKYFKSFLIGFLILVPNLVYGFDDQNLPWLHAFSLYNQPKYAKDFKNFDYINPEAPKKGVFKLRQIGTFDSLNPYILKGLPAEGHFLTIESLMKRSADEPFTMYGRIAEAIQLPEDRRWIRFRLRQEAVFHDGSPIQAEDVEFSYQLLKTKGLPNLRYFYDKVEKTEILGPKDIVFYFKPYESRQLPLLLGFLPILSKAYYEEHPFDKPSLKPPLSSGPYKVFSVDPGKKIVYKRIPNFWGENLAINKGQYNFDEIHYIYSRDDNVALQAFQKHDYDFREEPDIQKWSVDYAFSAIKEGRVLCKSFPIYQSMGMLGFVFNLRKDIFKDRLVRKALSLALDFDWLNKTYLHTSYERTESFFIAPDLVARDLPKGEELNIFSQYKNDLPTELFDTPIEKMFTTTPQTRRADLQLARDLLKKAGWVIQKQKLINQKTGKAMSFEILLSQPFYEKIALSYVQNLQKLGILATVRTVDHTQYEQRVQDQDFDMVVHYWNQSYYPGDEQGFYWSSKQANIKGSKNIAGIANPVIDYLISVIPKAKDYQTYLTASRALDRVLRASHIVIPLFHPKKTNCAFWDQFGYPEMIPHHGFRQVRWWALHTWWEK